MKLYQIEKEVIGECLILLEWLFLPEPVRFRSNME
jgi:hypothetical protein